MALRLLTSLVLLSLGIGCGNGSRSSNKGLAGKFFLSECPTDSVAPDAIEFRPDGSCVVDAGGRTSIAGKYETSAVGHMSMWLTVGVVQRHLVIEADTVAWKQFICSYELGNYTLTMQDADGTPLIYVRMPEGPRPQFNQILGTFGVHNEAGDSAGDLTADYKFHDHLHELDPDKHLYHDVQVDGTCTYSNGVLTYRPEHSNAPERDKYLRDFIIKRDSKGLWQIDPYHDTIICEPPVTNLDLPPVPSGYRKEIQL